VKAKVEELNYLASLWKDGIRFTIYVPELHGGCAWEVSPRELLEYRKDKLAFIATRHGVTVREYLLWQDQGQSVRCAAKTLKKTRCKKNVVNGINVSPQDWVKLQGALCRSHV